MAVDSENQNLKDEKCDLSALENFSFQPQWERIDRANSFKPTGDSGGSSGDSRPRRDFRSKPSHGGQRRQSNSGQSQSYKGPSHGAAQGGGYSDSNKSQAPGEGFQRPRRPFNRDQNRDRPKEGFRSNNFRQNPQGRFVDRNRTFFQPAVSANFYAEDSVFDLVIQTLNSSIKTYELFNVARLFLEKPERFAVVLKKIDVKDDANLYLCTADAAIFLNKDDAIKHCLKNNLDKYFDIAEEDIEPPSGAFSCVHKCGLTGKLLCAPNYHRYAEIVNRHFENEIHHMPYERFKERIETVKDQEAIDLWKAAMSKRQIYALKNLTEGHEPVVLKDLVDVKNYFLEHLQNTAVKTAESFRVTGTQIDSMPRDIVKISLLSLIDREKKFPLNLSNNLRTKLKKAFFTIYKMGTKGITYVTRMKRKFRETGDKFEEKFDKIITCIDENQGLKLADLYLKLVEKLTEEDKNLPENSHDEFVRNLAWLITEGFVSEHESGKLFSTRIIDKHSEPVEESEKVETEPADLQEIEKIAPDVSENPVAYNELQIAENSMIEEPSVESFYHAETSCSITTNDGTVSCGSTITTENGVVTDQTYTCEKSDNGEVSDQIFICENPKE